MNNQNIHEGADEQTGFGTPGICARIFGLFCPLVFEFGGGKPTQDLEALPSVVANNA